MLVPSIVVRKAEVVVRDTSQEIPNVHVYVRAHENADGNHVYARQQMDAL
jgi:hypothetical protein